MNPRELLSRAFASSGIVGAVSLGQAVVGLSAQSVLARLLPPEVFGQLAFVLLVQGAVASLRTLQAGEYLVCKKDEFGEAYDTVFTTDLILGVLTAILGILFAWPIMRLAGTPGLAPVLRVSLLSCAILPFGVPAVLFHRRIDFFGPALPQAAGIVVGPIVKIGLALQGLGVYSIVIGELVRQTVETAILWRLAPVRPRLAVHRRLLVESLRFSLPITVTSMLTFYYWKVDDFVVGRMLGLEQLGYYWLAFRIPEYMLMFKGYFIPVIFAALARLEDPDHQSQAYRHLTRFTAYGTFPFVAVALVHGDLLIRWAFGDRWGPAVPAFKLLMLTCALRLCGGYGNDLFKISGRTWIYPVVATVNAVLLTIGVLVLTPRLGITGTGLAVLVTIALSLGPAELLLWRWFGQSPCRLLLRPIFILALCTVGASFVRHTAALPGPVGFAIQSLGLVVAFLALAALLDAEAVRDGRRLLGLPAGGSPVTP